VIGVVRPGASAAVRITKTGRIAVISTEGTAREGAYAREIRKLRADAHVIAQACPLFVALAEEGWTQGPIVDAVARKYLNAIFAVDGASPATIPDTLVLGCTHFPPLAGSIRGVIGPDVAIVDSAATTAEVVASTLESRGLARHASAPPPEIRVLATDAPDRFARVARHFLPPELVPSSVELVDL
jgi:glutamate racemase